MDMDINKNVYRRFNRVLTYEYDQKGVSASESRSGRKQQVFKVGSAGQICGSDPRVRTKQLAGQCGTTRYMTRISRVMT